MLILSLIFIVVALLYYKLIAHPFIPLHQLLPVITFHRLIHWALLGVGVLQSSLFDEALQVSGSCGGCEIAKLLKPSSGKVLVGVEIICKQSVDFMNVQLGGMFFMGGSLEFCLFFQVLFKLGIGSEIYCLYANLLLVHIGRCDVGWSG